MSESTFATSRQAYEYCMAHGLITQREALVLDALVNCGPMNQTMTYRQIVRATGDSDMVDRSVGPRFAVLERKGLIREVGKRKCPYTDRLTVFYEATANKPVVEQAEQTVVSGHPHRLSSERLAKIATGIKDQEANPDQQLFAYKSVIGVVRSLLDHIDAPNPTTS